MVDRRFKIGIIGWVMKTLETQVGQFLRGCKCTVSRGIVVQEQDSLGEIHAEIMQRIFLLGNFWGRVSHYATTTMIVALSLGHSDITRFCLCFPMTKRNHLDGAKRIPKIAQTTGTVDIFGMQAGILGPTLWRDPTCPHVSQAQ